MSTTFIPTLGKKGEIIFSLAGEITESEILAESNLTTDHTNIIGKYPKTWQNNGRGRRQNC